MKTKTFFSQLNFEFTIDKCLFFVEHFLHSLNNKTDTIKLVSQSGFMTYNL